MSFLKNLKEKMQAGIKNSSPFARNVYWYGSLAAVGALGAGLLVLSIVYPPFGYALLAVGFIHSVRDVIKGGGCPGGRCDVKKFDPEDKSGNTYPNDRSVANDFKNSATLRADKKDGTAPPAQDQAPKP